VSTPVGGNAAGPESVVQIQTSKNKKSATISEAHEGTDTVLGKQETNEGFPGFHVWKGAEGDRRGQGKYVEGQKKRKQYLKTGNHGNVLVDYFTIPRKGIEGSGDTGEPEDAAKVERRLERSVEGEAAGERGVPQHGRPGRETVKG